MAALAERSSSVIRMKHLSYQNEALELSESELSHVVQERAEGPKAPSPGHRPGYNSNQRGALLGQKPYKLPGILKLLPLQGDRFAPIITQGDALG